MTRILVDRIEQEEDRFAFGDPIGCHYHFLPPGAVDSYGDQVRHLGGKVERAVDAFERTATLPEDVFAGEAADTLRTRAGKRHEESALVRDNLRGLGRAINAYADVLRGFRDGLEDLRAHAVSRGLEVRANKIWPPVQTLPRDASPQEADTWEADWRAYQDCFDLKLELRATRRAGARELVRALAEHADVHPDRDRGRLVAASANQVRFGELRRDAAEEAREAIEARTDADAARQVVAALRRREQAALDDLEQLVNADRPPEEIAAQADKVARLHRELGDARTEAAAADATADREQAQANRAARALADAESGTSRPRAEQASTPAPEPLAETLAGGRDDGRPVVRPGDLRDRLG